MIFILVICLPSQSFALIVFGENNNTAEVAYDASTSSAEKSVVVMGSTSAVYLGNGWFVTAKHTGVSLESNVSQNGKSAQVSYIDNSLYSNYGVDLSLFFVENYSNLTSLSAVNLSASVYENFQPLEYDISGGGLTFEYGSNFLMVGAGRGRSSSSQLTDTLVNCDGVSGIIRSGNASYFGSQTDGGFDYILTMAEKITGSAQAQTGDSGGGLFFEFEDEYYLTGILVGVSLSAYYAKFGSYSDAMIDEFGDVDITPLNANSMTYSLDLQNYIDDIKNIISQNPIIPEPSTYAFLLGLSVSFFVFIRKKSF